MTTTHLITGEALGAMRGERILYTSLNLAVAPGDLVLLRGPNGSGKTTLLRQLAGLSQLQAGKIERAGLHHWIGHSHGLKPYETPRRHLMHWAAVWGASAEFNRILEELDMTRPADVPCRLLSAGQKRRTALGRLLIEHRPLWLLDEPFNALDSGGQAFLADLINSHRDRGGAVIAALHGNSPIEASQEVLL